MLPNISRSKGNQTLTFGQLITCNMRNIFLERSYIKYSGETSPGPFSGKLKLSTTLVYSFIQFVFIESKLRVIEIY